MQWVPNEKKEQPEQEPDDLTIAYMTGFHAGKNKDAPQREWVGLDDEDMKELRDANFDLLYGARWAERKLREKNSG